MFKSSDGGVYYIKCYHNLPSLCGIQEENSNNNYCDGSIIILIHVIITCEKLIEALQLLKTIKVCIASILLVIIAMCS